MDHKIHKRLPFSSKYYFLKFKDRNYNHIMSLLFTLMFIQSLKVMHMRQKPWYYCNYLSTSLSTSLGGASVFREKKKKKRA